MTDSMMTGDATSSVHNADYKDEIQDGTSKDSNVSRDDDNENVKPRELTRSRMALLFVLGFFSILFLCVAYAVKVNASLNELKDLLVAVIGALSGTLGFIVGFYYKSMKEQ